MGRIYSGFWCRHGGMFKTNTTLLCKDTIEKLEKDWPGVSYLMLKKRSMAPGDRPIISVVYNYNVQKVFYFISTEDTGITKAGITYLSKYHELFDNIDILIE